MALKLLGFVKFGELFHKANITCFFILYGLFLAVFKLSIIVFLNSLLFKDFV